MSRYSFFMAKCDSSGYADLSTTKNLEVDFKGLFYSKCEGIDALGAAKNIYEEKYADADGVRVHVPDVIYREPTTIKLTLFFIGANCRQIRDSFNDYIKVGFTKYWDDARKKSFVFYVSKDLPVGEEKWNGDTIYLKCEYTLSNINGETFSTPSNPFYT